MATAILKIKTFGEYLTDIKPKMFKIFLCANICMLVLYLCILGVVVNEAVGAKQSGKDLQLIGQEYQNLESEYFASLEQIDLDYARSLGFVDRGVIVQYAVRKTSFAKK